MGVSPVEAQKPNYINPYLKAQPFQTEVGASYGPLSLDSGIQLCATQWEKCIGIWRSGVNRGEALEWELKPWITVQGLDGIVLHLI